MLKIPQLGTSGNAGTNLVIAAASAVVVGAVSYYYFFSHDVTPVATAAAAEIQMVASTNMVSLEQQLVNAIITYAQNRDTAHANIDRIKTAAATYRIRLEELIKERLGGRLNETQMRQQLTEIVKELAVKLEIPLRLGHSLPNPAPWNFYQNHLECKGGERFSQCTKRCVPSFQPEPFHCGPYPHIPLPPPPAYPSPGVCGAGMRWSNCFKRCVPAGQSEPFFPCGPSFPHPPIPIPRPILKPGRTTAQNIRNRGKVCHAHCRHKKGRKRGQCESTCMRKLNRTISRVRRSLGYRAYSGQADTDTVAYLTTSQQRRNKIIGCRIICRRKRGNKKNCERKCVAKINKVLRRINRPRPIPIPSPIPMPPEYYPQPPVYTPPEYYPPPPVYTPPEYYPPQPPVVIPVPQAPSPYVSPYPNTYPDYLTLEQVVRQSTTPVAVYAGLARRARMARAMKATHSSVPHVYRGQGQHRGWANFPGAQRGPQPRFSGLN